MAPRNPPRGANLHPQDHSPDQLHDDTFDIIVIGSGPVGRTLAAQTTAHGLSTVIIEEELFGGDCPYWACVPSKALLRPAEAIAVSRQISGAKELIASKPTVDVQAVFARRDKFTQNWDDKFLVDISLSQGCSVIRGHGTLLAEKQVLVKNTNGTKKILSANHAVVLATGSEPVIPDIPGLADIPYWTPREATSSNEVPGHLIVVGAGAVGTEMATLYTELGGQVSLISSSAEILPQQEPQAGKMVRESLRKAGVDVRLSVRVQEVHGQGDKGISVKLTDGGVIEGTHILIATGRVPRTTGIGLEELGIATPLAVNDSLEVTSAEGKWLYAIGDTNRLNPMTHMGAYQARVAANAIVTRVKSNATIDVHQWSRFSNTADHRAVTQVVFTDPNIASVGLTKAEASRRGSKVRAVEVPFQFPGAWLHAEMDYEGWAQWVIDTEKNTLVGATFVGREAADLVHASTVAIVGEIPIDRLLHAVPSFPSMSEIYVALYTAI